MNPAPAWLALALLLPASDAGPVDPLLYDSTESRTGRPTEREEAAPREVAVREPTYRRTAWLDLRVNGGLVISGDLLDDGFGLEAGLRLQHPNRWLGVRAAAGFLALGENEDVSAGVMVENTLVTLLAGPELLLPLGPVEPFVDGEIGLALNVLDGSGPGGAIDDTDAAFAWRLGGGLRLILARGSHPVAVQASASVLSAGELERAALSFDLPRTVDSDVAVLSLAAGVTIGLR